MAALNATHRVAVFGAVGDPHPLAEILCEVLHERPTDAVIHAHLTPGVLAPRMTAEQAARVVSLLDGLGLQACAVAAAELPDFEAATVVHHAHLLDPFVEIVDYRGDVAERIAWGRIDLIAIGDVPLETTRHESGATRPLMSAATQPGTSTVQVQMSAGPEMWWVTREPMRVYRIDHRQLNYETLGDRKSDSATANFRLFAADFVTSATEAWKTPSTRAYLDHHPAAEYRFASSADLQRQALLHWVMGRQALREAQG